MTDNCKIYKGIPVPKVRRGGSRAKKYAFADLEIGDMFFVPNPPKSFRTQAYAAGRKLGYKFVIGEAKVGDQVGLGCWRVEAEPAVSDASQEELAAA